MRRRALITPIRRTSWAARQRCPSGTFPSQRRSRLPPSNPHRADHRRSRSGWAHSLSMTFSALITCSCSPSPPREPAALRGVGTLGGPKSIRASGAGREDVILRKCPSRPAPGCLVRIASGGWGVRGGGRHSSSCWPRSERGAAAPKDPIAAHHLCRRRTGRRSWSRNAARTSSTPAAPPTP